MNVLILGGGNSIALHLARYLHRFGHRAILADTNRFARGYYSRYCHAHRVFPGIDGGREGYTAAIKDCIRDYDVGLVVPTTDEAMDDLLRAELKSFPGVKFTFPGDSEKIKFVMDKRNIPFLCREAGIGTVETFIAGNHAGREHWDELSPPYVVKPSRSRGGSGFRKVASREELKAIFGTEQLSAGEGYVVQSSADGAVYGAGAVWEDKALKHFYSYKSVRRHPALFGTTTICQADLNNEIKKAMSRALAFLEWEGYCQMDFILAKRTGEPLLIDINPVHWYSIPGSHNRELNMLSYYVNGPEKQKEAADFTDYTMSTVLLFREMQRLGAEMIAAPAVHADDRYWKYYLTLQRDDFYWDPLPVVLAPLLNLLRTIYSQKSIANDKERAVE